MASQQTSMMAALGSIDRSYLKMGSMSGVGHLQPVNGLGQFHNNAFKSFSPSGIISRLNTAAGLDVHGFQTSGLLQLGQSQYLNNFKDDQLNIQPATVPVNPNRVRGMSVTMGLDQLQDNMGVIPVQNMTTDFDRRTTTSPISNKLPDQRARITTSVSHTPLLGSLNNALMLETHPQDKPGGIGYENSSSAGAFQHSEIAFSLLDKGRYTDNWSSDVKSSAIMTNSYPPSECFRQTATPPSIDNMASLPLQGVNFTNKPGQTNSNVPFQGWDDHNQNATYHSNVIDGSISSPTTVNEAVVPAGHTPTNSTMPKTLDYNFCDPLQMKRDGFVELTEDTPLKQHQGNIMNQQKPQESCFSNNFGSLEDLVYSMMAQVIIFLLYKEGFPKGFCMTSFLSYLLQSVFRCLMTLNHLKF